MQTVKKSVLLDGLHAVDWFLGYLGFPVQKAERDEYLEREAEIAALLIEFWESRSERALQEIAATLSTFSGAVSDEEITWALRQLQQALGPEFVGDVAERLRQALSAVYVMSRKSHLNKEPEWRLVDAQAQQALMRDTLYWVGNHYSDDLGQEIAATVRRLMIEEGLGRVEGAKALQAALGEQLGRSKAYWEIVASAAANRSRNFGAVESFVEAGVEVYEVQAMGDERMCPVCGSLDGRLFRVSDAVALRDKLLAAETPDEWKDIAPWDHGKGYASINTAKLPEHAKLPPYHGRCRCGVMARLATPDIAQQVRDAVNNYRPPSADELTAWTDKAKVAPWADGKLQVHVDKHKVELAGQGVHGEQAYDSWARSVFTTPGVEIYAVLNKHWYPQLWFYDPVNKRRAIVNMQGLQLATAHPASRKSFARALINTTQKVLGVQSVSITKAIAAFWRRSVMQKADNQIEYQAAVWAEYAAMAGVPDKHGPDGDWFMEPVIVLGMRDDLPAAAAVHPTALEADRRIFSQREKLLPYFHEAYQLAREDESPPRSAWWWWLDEVVAGTYDEALPEYLSEQ